MKGIGKAIKRTPFAVTSRIGMSKKSNDPEFDDYQRNFTNLEGGAEKLLKHTKAFTEAVTLLFTSGANYAAHSVTIFQPMAGEHDLIGKHPDAGHTIRNVTKYEAAMEEMRSLVAPELELIESRIMGPLKELQTTMKLIRKTITKREHKLVDYDRFNNSLTKLRDKKEKSLSDEKNLFKLEQDFEQATNEYEYINTALKQDLPRFMTLSTQFIDPLFNSLFYMQLNIYYLILEKMNAFADEGKYDITNVPGAQIQQDYENKRSDAWEVIESLNIIKRIISVSKLVQATRSQNNLGTGGVNRSPSTGSVSRATPPSAPSFKKAPPPPPGAATSRAPPPPYTPSSSGSSAAAVAATKRAPPPPPPLKPKPKIVPQVQYVIALYDFAAQADGDLSFNTGDRIEVVERTGNTEDWWTGRVNGQQGVFPGNYVQDA
ncbi:hypothetical protein D9615_006407 [Tricholomella constricta]|uniref:BAR-domain-containing protein n=1 Tax=Tricholomella constricta TaxID=117010 RepID=A0A8H5H5S8_9AGAR|nr:hypothetical protein D9615_006407 [Tricholomella constricta]